MAWTTPRTWVTGEVVTAALLNTHLRDNLDETAPATVTTAGDLVYATGANALARLGIGADNLFLGGGSSAPVWTGTLGSATNNPIFTLKGTDPRFRMQQTDATDANDFWEMVPESAANDFLWRYWDDSASGWTEAMDMAVGDYVLHTGKNSGETGAYRIGTDTLGSTGLTTTGTGALGFSMTTGGPAYVIGHYSIALTRSAAGSAGDEVRIIPQDDGSTIAAAFNLTTGNDWADAMIPSNGDTGIYQGFFYSRQTSDNTSTWSVNLSASVNSVFTASASSLIVISTQYPT